MAAPMIFGRRGCVAAASIRNPVWKSFELCRQKIQSRPSLLRTLGSTRRLEAYGVPLDNGKINAEVLRDHIEIRKSFMPNVLLKNVHSDKISQMILEMKVSNS